MILTGIITGCFVLFLNYCFGKPGSEKFSPHEIFSFYTIWLSKRRLKEVGLYWTYFEQYQESEKRMITKIDKINLKNDFRKQLYNEADPFFTWERAAGMCPVCFGFWLSCGSATFFAKNVLDLLIIVAVSHVTIRLLNKVI